MLIYLVIIICVVYLYINKDSNIELMKNIDYRNRLLINHTPNFKLNAYCINLKGKKDNMNFINNEWKDFLNITRFEALNSATNSHISLLKNIWLKKSIEKFPIVIMEDDVFRRGNFTKYWDKLLDIEKCDYIAFDAFYLEFKNDSKYEDFISLKSHRAMGFNVYYKYFFDHFKNIEDLHNFLNKGVIDTNFTHNTNIIKYTPKEQVCRQIVSKMSTTNNSNTNRYLKYYEIAEEKLNYK